MRLVLYRLLLILYVPCRNIRTFVPIINNTWLKNKKDKPIACLSCFTIRMLWNAPTKTTPPLHNRTLTFETHIIIDYSIQICSKSTDRTNSKKSYGLLSFYTFNYSIADKSSFTYSVCGSNSTFLVDPCSTIFPDLITRTRSHTPPTSAKS